MSKDEEVSQLNSLVYDLQRQLQAARMDTEKNMITDLVQVCAFILLLFITYSYVAFYCPTVN